MGKAEAALFQDLALATPIAPVGPAAAEVAEATKLQQPPNSNLLRHFQPYEELRVCIGRGYGSPDLSHSAVTIMNL